LVQLKGVFKKAGLALNSGFSIIMPTNYARGAARNKRRTAAPVDCRWSENQNKSPHTSKLKNQTSGKGPLWQRLSSTHISFGDTQLAKMDRSFRAMKNVINCASAPKSARRKTSLLMMANQSGTTNANSVMRAPVVSAGSHTIRQEHD